MTDEKLGGGKEKDHGGLSTVAGKVVLRSVFATFLKHI